MTKRLLYVSVCLAMFVCLLRLGLTEAEIVRDLCGPGWDAPDADSKWCYKFVYDRMASFNWYAARQHCHNHNSDLLVIDSVREAKWIRDFMVKQKNKESESGVYFDAGAWYIDAHKQLYCEDDEPCWRDGRPLDDSDIFEYIRDSGEKTDCYERKFTTLQACYAVDFNDLLFKNITVHDVDCATNYGDGGFICKKKRNAVPPAEPPQLCTYKEAQNFACPPGWRKPESAITAAPYCYKFVDPTPTDVSWNDAYRTCKSMQSELVYVENSNEARWITSSLSIMKPIATRTQRYAINLHYFMYDYSAWSFPNHLARAHSGLEWETGKPDSTCGIEECAELWTPRDRYVLNDIPCSTVGLRLGYICKKPLCHVGHKANATLSVDRRGSSEL